MLNLLLIDNHVLFRQGLVSLLAPQPTLNVLGEGSTVADAISLANELRPDLILMDFILPDGTGLKATRTILRDQPNIVIVFLTVYDDNERLFAAIRSGATGFLPKSISFEKLIYHLHRIELGKPALPGEMTSSILQEFNRMSAVSSVGESEALARLTTREMDVVYKIVSGASNREIASSLVISVNTVKNHVSNILRKLNLRNRRELIHFAREVGIRPE